MTQLLRSHRAHARRLAVDQTGRLLAKLMCLAGLLLVACVGADSERFSELSEGLSRSGKHPHCRHVQLVAGNKAGSRSSHHFRHRFTFLLPTSVELKGADRGTGYIAAITFERRSARRGVTCRYVRSAYDSQDSAALESCEDGSRAGDEITAERVSLTLTPKRGATARVRLHSPRCQAHDDPHGGEGGEGGGSDSTPATCDPETCTSNSACVAAYCESNACVRTPHVSGTPCNDGDVCNGTETCDGTGECRPGIALLLDDADPCTTDTCHPTTGPAHEPVAGCGDPDVTPVLQPIELPPSGELDQAPATFSTPGVDFIDPANVLAGGAPEVTARSTDVFPSTHGTAFVAWSIEPPRSSDQPIYVRIELPSSQPPEASLLWWTRDDASGTWFVQSLGRVLPDGEHAIFTLRHFSVHAVTTTKTFVVDSGKDAADCAPGDGNCNAFAEGSNACSPAPGTCTLRAALMESNFLRGPQEITFRISSGPVTIEPTKPLPPARDTVIIDATTQSGFSSSPLEAAITLSGSLLGVGKYEGLVLEGSGSIVRGLAIQQFSGSGIVLSGTGKHMLDGNLVGTDRRGISDRGNGFQGIRILNSPKNVVGVDSAGRGLGNVISGNDDANVAVVGAKSIGNHIAGNTIGAAASGQNRLSEPATTGVGVAIGVGSDSALGVPANNTVGGASEKHRNLISGNADEGVIIDGGSPGNIVRGNYIGTVRGGDAALPNGGTGVRVSTKNADPPMSVSTRIADNLISGHAGAGIRLDGPHTSNVMIEGNSLGTQADGNNPLGNLYGVRIELGAHDNVVGFAAGAALAAGCAGRCNTIAHNDIAGVRVLDNAAGNTIRGNQFFKNHGLAIDLGELGVTANDLEKSTVVADADTGANELLNFPAMLRPVFDLNGIPYIRGVYDLGGRAAEGIVIDVYSIAAEDTRRIGVQRPGAKYNDDPTKGDVGWSIPGLGASFGQGRTWLGTVHPSDDGSFELKIERKASGPKPIIYAVATATDARGNTSELSAFCNDVPSAADPSQDPDSDADGLCDDWEQPGQKSDGSAAYGVDYDGDGTFDLPLGLYSAATNRPDVFVEIDATPGEEPASLQEVVSAFDRAPNGGVGLHLNPGLNALVDDQLVDLRVLSFDGQDLDSDGATTMREVRQGDSDKPCDGHFGTAEERDSHRCAAILRAKSQIFRYAVFSYQLAREKEVPRNTAGVSSKPGSNMAVAIGHMSAEALDTAGGHGCGSTCRNTLEQRVFMHELGHALGLGHGGIDDINYKPNYFSIMNYWFADHRFDHDGPPLDYSRFHVSDLAPMPLREAHLQESSGLGPTPPGGWQGWKKSFFSGLGSPDNLVCQVLSIPTDTAASTRGYVDWNGSNLPESQPVEARLNEWGSVANEKGEYIVDLAGCWPSSSAPEILVTSNDWDYLQYVFAGTGEMASLAQETFGFTEEGILFDAEHTDSDRDRVFDAFDNCVDDPNPGQEDADHDGTGDACEALDSDADGVDDSADNCPTFVNPDQRDSDHDGQGDHCDYDYDSDSDQIANLLDNCPDVRNAGQVDRDGDGLGDACDPDAIDSDGDGVFDAVDNCQWTRNANQHDRDGDGTGNACDNDNDNDGVADDFDDCPALADPAQLDSDGDGMGDACESIAFPGRNVGLSDYKDFRDVLDYTSRASISDSGRFVAVEHSVPWVIPPPPSLIFRVNRDLDSDGQFDEFGDTQKVQISVGLDGTAPNGGSRQASISADGNLVAFISYASNLVVGDTNGRNDVFVRDAAAGTTRRLSVASDGAELPDFLGAGDVALSADGQVAVFEVLEFMANGVASAVFRRNLGTGNMQRLGRGFRPSVSADGGVVAWDVDGMIAVHDLTLGSERVLTEGSSPAVSADGKYIALVAPSGVVQRVQLASSTVENVSVTSDGVTTSGSEPSISADGRWVAFASIKALVPGDANGAGDVYVRDVQQGTTLRGSVSIDGGEPEAWVTQPSAYSSQPAISLDGRTIAFTSNATNIVDQEPNYLQSAVYVRGRSSLLH